MTDKHGMETILEKPIENAASTEEKQCPFCAETILAQAVKCRYCGEFFDTPPQLPTKKSKWFHSTACAIIALIMLGPLGLPLIWTNPRFNVLIKTAITIAIAALTTLLLYLMLSIYNNMIDQFTSLGI